MKFVSLSVTKDYSSQSELLRDISTAQLLHKHILIFSKYTQVC
jgi:hypothetical protein